jgi:hypothetical protein
LSLVSTGDGDRYAIASRSDWSLEGKAIWHWKDRIDRRFMVKYSDLPEMAEARGTEVPQGLADQDAIMVGQCRSNHSAQSCHASVSPSPAISALPHSTRPPCTSSEIK